MDGVLGIASGGASMFSQDIIDKLKAEDEKAYVKPIEDKIALWDEAVDEVAGIEASINKIFDTLKQFETTSDDNVFDRVNVSTTGDSVTFDAPTTKGLEPGTINITVNQVATKDVWQSDLLTNAPDDTMEDATITIAGVDYTTNDKTFQEFADELNKESNLQASYVQVGTDSDGNAQYRLIIKSTQTGEDNALDISTKDGKDYFSDGDSDDDGIDDNHVLVAQNLKATIDGVDFEQASNTLKIEAELTMTAYKTGDSSITISKDTTAVQDSIQAFVDAYNEAVDLIDKQYEDDAKLSKLKDIDKLESIIGGIKERLFRTYGVDSDGNATKDRDGDGDKDDDDKLYLFNMGIEFTDEKGHLSLDTTKLTEVLNSNPNAVKDAFSGDLSTGESGFGDEMFDYRIFTVNTPVTGLLPSFEEEWTQLKADLEEQRDKEQSKIDERYAQMQAQFAEYAAMTAKMEALFNGLKMQIQMETASK